MPNHIVYAYGTLRPGSVTQTTKIRGTLYDLGRFPGLKLGLPEYMKRTVTCEKISVDDRELAKLDRYEGYYEDDTENSLYLRIPYRDGWIYTFNRPVDGYPVITSGDWLIHKELVHGT